MNSKCNNKTLLAIINDTLPSFTHTYKEIIRNLWICIDGYYGEGSVHALDNLDNFCFHVLGYCLFSFMYSEIKYQNVNIGNQLGCDFGYNHCLLYSSLLLCFSTKKILQNKNTNLPSLQEKRATVLFEHNIYTVC